MPNYKEMYYKLFHATEQAVYTLIQAQQECEDLFINQPEPDLKVFSISHENTKSMEE